MSEYKFKTELHTHTTPISICSEIPPDRLAAIYKSGGYDSVAVTNHFHPGIASDDDIKWYIDDYLLCKATGEALGLSVIFGAELRFTENRNDYLIFGICPEDLYDIKDMLSMSFEDFYKAYKNDKNIILQAHPFRNDMERVNPAYLDGIEAFNMHPNHNSRVALAAEYARENNLIPICGTDFHHPGQECLSAIFTKEKITDSYQLAEVIKSRDFVMEIGGYKLTGI